MIKLTGNYLPITSRAVPLIILAIIIWLTVNCIELAFWPVYIVYGFILLMILFKAKLWRFGMLSDVFVNNGTNQITFRKLNGAEETFSREQILTYKTYNAITDVTLSQDGRNVKKYFIAIFPGSLRYLDDGFQDHNESATRSDNADYPGMSYYEVRTRKFISKYWFLFFIPILIVIPLMMVVGLHLAKKQDQEILAMRFNGRVDSIWYDPGKDGRVVTRPHVSIHGKTYDLFYRAWGFKHDILPGDSLIKQENTFTVTLIKQDGKKLVYTGD
ncbi:MAG: hypothetical protein JSU01_00935 [Bacteroidetes bacterium]|nr:hypothetical protein [Bacteroidota bacterium]